MIDGWSPLTSIESEMESERLVRAGSDTSQLSEGSSLKTTKRLKVESEDEYKDEGSSDEEMVQEEQQDMSVSVTSSQKRKRKYSRRILNDDDEEEEDASYSVPGESDTGTRTMSSSMKARGSGRRSTSYSAARKRPKDHTIHSDSDDRPFKASVGSARTRSTSDHSASQERVLNNLRVDGTWAPQGSSPWGVRPKRNAAKKYPDYEVSSLGVEGTALERSEPHIEAAQSIPVDISAQPIKPRRGRPPQPKDVVKVEDAPYQPLQVDDPSGSTQSPDSVNLTGAAAPQLDVLSSAVEEPAQSFKRKKPGRKPRILLKGTHAVIQPGQTDLAEDTNGTSSSTDTTKLSKTTKKRTINITNSDLDITNVDDLAGNDSITSMSSVPSGKPGRAKRAAATKVINYYIPQIDIDADLLASDVETSISRKPIKSRVAKVKEAGDMSELSSYDSLFDGNAFVFSEDERAAVNTLPSHTKRKSPIWDASTILNYNLMVRYGKTYVPQVGLCQRTKDFQQCRHCTARQMGDTCRFIGIRALPARLEQDEIQIIAPTTKKQDGPIFIDDTTVNEMVILPDHYDLNRPMDDDSKVKIMTTAAISLVGILREGLEHARKPGCIRRARELQIRAMCDFCSTGLFSASYICKRCGGEYCLACKSAIDGSAEKDYSQSHLFTCVKDKIDTVGLKYGRRYIHSNDTMFPMSRFTIEELEEEVAAMEKVIEANASNVSTSTMQPESGDFDGNVEVMQPGQTSEDVPSHPLNIENKKTMNEIRFLSTWAKGEPIVVTNIHTQKSWNPAAFVEKYGEMDCEIVRCDEHAPFMLKEKMMATLRTNPMFLQEWEKRVKVRDFFETFGKADEERAEIFGKGIWKLKVSLLMISSWELVS